MVRRLVFDFDVPAAASGSTGSSDGTASSDTASSSQFTIDLFDFGAPVSIVPPPPDQVTDASCAAATTDERVHRGIERRP